MDEGLDLWIIIGISTRKRAQLSVNLYIINIHWTLHVKLPNAAITHIFNEAVNMHDVKRRQAHSSIMSHNIWDFTWKALLQIGGNLEYHDKWRGGKYLARRVVLKWILLMICYWNNFVEKQNNHGQKMLVHKIWHTNIYIDKRVAI